MESKTEDDKSIISELENHDTNLREKDMIVMRVYF